MAFSSINDPDFWGHLPEEVEAINRAGGNEGLDLSYFLLGKMADNPPFVTPLRMEPDYVLPRHAHDCYRMEIIVQGSMDVGDRILTAGSVMYTEPGVLYGPHVAGPQGCTTFEICSEFSGGHRLLLEDEAGALVPFNMLESELATTIVAETSKRRKAARGV
jgi:hypothetical protein